MNARVPGATRLSDIVFIIVVINTMAQGPTLPWAARRLKVTASAEPLDVDVETAPLEALHADLLQVQIPPESRLHGVEISELRLPAQANIALIVRDGKGFVPSPTTTLRIGDRLLIVASAAVREQTERRLRAVAAQASWPTGSANTAGDPVARSRPPDATARWRSPKLHRDCGNGSNSSRECGAARTPVTVTVGIRR